MLLIVLAVISIWLESKDDRESSDKLFGMQSVTVFQMDNHEEYEAVPIEHTPDG